MPVGDLQHKYKVSSRTPMKSTSISTLRAPQTLVAFDVRPVDNKLTVPDQDRLSQRFSMMYARASSFSHAGYQYQHRQAEFSQDQPRSYSQPTAQHGQFVGPRSQQSPINPENTYGPQDWTAVYDVSGASMDLNAYQVTNMSGGMDLDLPSQPNPEELSGVDVDAFTTSAYQEWRPPGFADSDMVPPAYPSQPEIRHYGALSDPTPNIPQIIELSSDDTSNHDSAYVTARHPTATDQSVDEISFVEQIDDHGSDLARPSCTRPKFASDTQIQQAGGRRGRRRVAQQPPCHICKSIGRNFVPKNASDAT